MKVLTVIGIIVSIFIFLLNIFLFNTIVYYLSATSDSLVFFGLLYLIFLVIIDLLVLIYFLNKIQDLDL